MKNIITLILCILVFNTSAQITVQDISPETYIPPGELPQYLDKQVHTGLTDITRVSTLDWGVTGQRLGHHYSSDQAWNADQTLIKLNGYPAAILNADTYQFEYWSTIPSQARWSNIEPKKMYGTSGSKFVKYDVETEVRTTLYDFGYDISLGFGEGNPDMNDKYVGLISDNYLIIYNIEDNTYNSIDRISGDLDWFSVSPLGSYAVISWRPDGTALNEGLKIWNIDFTNLRHLTNFTEHSDMGVDEDGSEIHVSWTDPLGLQSTDYYAKKIRLNDGLITPILYREDKGIWGGHISLRNTGRPGWAYFSEGCCPSHGFLPKENFALKLDGSDEIEIFGKHHTNHSLGYLHQAKTTVNRDGTKILFTSNWNKSVPYAFIISQSTLSNNTFKVKDQIPNEIIYYNMLGQKFNNINNLPRAIYIEHKIFDDRVKVRKFIKHYE